MRIDPNKIMQTLVNNGLKIRATARELGISPGTVINWRRRARSIYGKLRIRTTGLARKSTRPHKHRTTTLSAVQQDAIVSIRKQVNFCAQKIVGTLKLQTSHMAVHRFLVHKGLVAHAKRHRRPKFQDTIHMHAKNALAPGKLQMDVKYITPQLSGLPYTCFLYAIIDIYSRYKLGVIFPDCNQDFAIQALKTLVPVLPCKPDFIQTDNGLEFQSRFHEFVTGKLGLKHHYIHKSTPNENAVIERSFRTDEDEFFFFQMKRRAKDIADLNAMYSEYLLWYNTERIHLGINLKTPLEVIQAKTV